MIRVMLIGNPNCGKTTLFNALTGDTQRIGNWPGVTVEKKTGSCVVDGRNIDVTDLPGVYSLSATSGSAQDAQITAHAVANDDADVILNVIDACHLERHLYLTSQLLELGKPVIIALNMMDLAEQRGITIDIKALARQLGCPVVTLQAHKHVGIAALQQILLQTAHQSTTFSITFPLEVATLLTQFEQYLLKNNAINPQLISYHARRVLESGELGMLTSTESITLPHDLDILLADVRYDAVHNLVCTVQTKRSDASEHFTAKLDRVVLNRFWALPIFLGMMYLMFLLAINVGGAFQDFFDITTDALFVQGSAWLLRRLNSPDWLIALCANGIGKGINTTMTFIPVIAVMFFLLSLLETSGYMARAAFVVDKAMRFLGLPGKSFVPMIVGFGCNVPAIMAARALDSERDRVLTVLMSPFMSCSARLTIYAVFVAAFFPKGGQNIVFALYLIGIIMAILTGLLLRKTILHGQASPLILELPAYHRPSLQRLFRETSLRLRYFLVRAGRLIIPICVILGGLNAWMIGEPGVNQLSILATIGQWMTPMFSPMGIHQDNWPAVVGLLTGTLAKEVVIGSLNSLYTQVGHLTQLTSTSSFDFLSSMQTALWSIPSNLLKLGEAVINPILASATNERVSQSVYGIMYQCFHGQAAAFSYLLFILLYIPCASTMAAIRQETNAKLMWFSIIWSLLIAYSTAVMFYQFATGMEHMQQTMTWFIALTTLLFLAVSGLRFGGRYVIATA
ncbi:MAG: Fe(2+) transporter permease subunit FeoB [Legionellaceae bacterium]|nr:Fe(2+) transporter permease subunit FeoB [Legionellaceae bacterium]